MFPCIETQCYKVTQKESLFENWKLKCNKDSQKWELLCVVLLFFIPCCVLYSTISYSHFQFPLWLENDTFHKCNMHFVFQLTNNSCAGTSVRYWNWYGWKQKRIIFISTFRQIFCCFSTKFYTQKEQKRNFLFFFNRDEKKSSLKNLFLLTSNKIDDIDEMSSGSGKREQKKDKKGRFLFVIDNICCW